MSAKVKVAVRVRPMNKRERDMKALCVVDMDNNQTVLTSVEKNKSSKTFAFDHCFWTMDPSNPKYADQAQVFQALGMDILDNAFEGYNACIFAYGQTGSGKSYTMMGSLGDEATKGIIPRLCDTLFDKIAQNEKPRVSFKVEVSYMEIYCEKVKDLLCPKGGKSSLKVREHKSLGPYVENLSKLAVSSFKNINDLMSEGNKSRTVAATQMNAESSRSHAVFSIVLTQTEFDPASQNGTEKVAKISLVDLAGSERVSKTGALGERLKEGSLINKSLTTLGLVISALADISAGKKARNSYIPYRDSTLTWLLKDNLGGNSKTVMVATVSPASENFEETLSTLRYADRAKRIVNHAVINEDPNSRVIRELREEVEKLRGLIGGDGPGGGATNTKEISELQDRLKISEGLMTEMSKSWEQRLAETERIHQERHKALEDMGISVQEAGIGVQVDKYYMVNLNADPSLNELLVCYLKPLTRVGRVQAQVPQDIVLRGLGIANEHCIIEIEDKDVYITPVKGARTLVNGVPVSERVPVRHGGRILLGNNHLYRLSCPHTQDRGQTEEGEESSELMDYEQAMKEISINELTNDPLYSKVQENLTKKHEEEKEGALAAQRQKYEEQLALLKEQLETSNATSPTPPKHKYTTIEEEWEEKNRERLKQSVLLANRLVQEANMLADALHKDTVFKVTLTVPRSYLSPTQHVESSDTTNEVAIRVLHKQRGTDSVWTTDTLEEKVLTMREMFERMEEGGSLLDEAIGPDPFYDLEQHALLGVANFYLECLNHDDIVHDYIAPIVAPTGKVCGKLRVAIQRLPSSVCVRDDDVDAPELYVPVDDVVDIGSRIPIQVSVLEASGLPKEYSHYVFCQYQFWKEGVPMIIPPLVQTTLDKPAEKVQRFEHVQVFTVEVTEEFLDYLEEGALAVEVWGHRRSGFNELTAGPAAPEEANVHRHKSFPERWSELIKHLEVVVEMMELSEQGEYVPVEIQSKPEVLTGGVFMIRQGQSRRINVTVKQLESAGVSPLQVDHIASIAVGSMYLRNRYDEALDSFQKDDLQRLRTKWSNALMNRREYLDAEVRKMMDKREQSVSDLEKQNELLDQWAMLQWQRAAVLQPKVGSGVPGAPNNWNFPPGFEGNTPVLFLDLTDDLAPSEDDSEGVTGTGELFGEKPETMITLPIFNSDSSKGSCQATASWDSTVHNTNSLNKITGNNDRVYGIIKVGVVMQHPPGLEITLRKRICLRVYKKIGFGATLMRAFAGKENRSTCGVLYEVVTGIPKSEGMDPPPQIPANPSFVELDKDENAVEKFKTAMTSVSSILHLDKLKQDVALKEKLTISGKSLRKRITVGEATPQSLSRADSGIIFQPGGSQGESPTPATDSRLSSSGPDGLVSLSGTDDTSNSMLAADRRRSIEECATVGSKAVGISTTSEPQQHRYLAVEEALGVGGDTNARLDVIPEVETSILVGVSMGGVRQHQQLVHEEDEEAKAAPVTIVPPDQRSQLSENPETGQSEVVHEIEDTEHRLESTSDQGREQEGNRTSDGGSEVELQERVGGKEETKQVVQEEEQQPVAEGEDRATKELTSAMEEEEPLVMANKDSEAGHGATMLPTEQQLSLQDTQQLVLEPELQEVKDAVATVSSHQTTEQQQSAEEEALAGDKLTDVKDTEHQSTPANVKDTEDQSIPANVKGTEDQSTPAKDTAEQSAPAKDTAEQSAPAKDTAEQSTPTIELVHVPEVMKASEELVADSYRTQVAAEEEVELQESNPESPQHHAPQSSSSTPRSTSPTPSTGSESSSVAEATRSRKPSPPPCSMGEKVMVEITGGFKMGVVKFIGETEFAAGEWIGVALDKPTGKHNGTVKGVKYFKCRDKHGIFVKRDKILHHPSASPSSLTGKPPSPLTKQRRVTSNPQLGKPPYSGRRTSYGPRR